MNRIKDIIYNIQYTITQYIINIEIMSNNKLIIYNE